MDSKGTIKFDGKVYAELIFSNPSQDLGTYEFDVTPELENQLSDYFKKYQDDEEEDFTLSDIRSNDNQLANALQQAFNNFFNQCLEEQAEVKKTLKEFYPNTFENDKFNVVKASQALNFLAKNRKG